MRYSKNSPSLPNVRSTQSGSSAALSIDQDSNPTTTAMQRAKTVALSAIADGWGAPHDPVALADYLKLELTPRHDIRGARTITTQHGSPCIEFNPNEPWMQMCYSVAVEIARVLLFEGRTSGEPGTDTAMQIETLCRIAATELLTPAGSLSLPEIVLPSLDFVLDLQQKKNVSAEALLSRVAAASAGPCTMFCASRIEHGSHQGLYKIDYTVESRSWAAQIRTGLMLPNMSVVGACTAIGAVAKNTEQWSTGPLLFIECVGIWPLPGASYPRVAGLARLAACS